jgi:hypothetical protein
MAALWRAQRSEETQISLFYIKHIYYIHTYTIQFKLKW